MTERKPIGVSYEAWIDRQIREAAERGEFDNLPGKGKPIPNLDRPWDLTHWAAEMLRRENLSILPPALELRRHVERELAEIMQLGAEIGVRKAVEALNQHIRETNKTIYEGPASLVHPLDVAEVLTKWRAAQSTPGS